MGWVLMITFVDGAQSDQSACSYTTRYTITCRCLLDATMVSSNHTITLKIDEESQGSVANTIA